MERAARVRAIRHRQAHQQRDERILEGWWPAALVRLACGAEVEGLAHHGARGCGGPALRAQRSRRVDVAGAAARVARALGGVARAVGGVARAAVGVACAVERRYPAALVA